MAQNGENELWEENDAIQGIVDDMSAMASDIVSSDDQVDNEADSEADNADNDAGNLQSTCNQNESNNKTKNNQRNNKEKKRQKQTNGVAYMRPNDAYFSH